MRRLRTNLAPGLRRRLPIARVASRPDADGRNANASPSSARASPSRATPVPRPGHRRASTPASVSRRVISSQPGRSSAVATRRAPSLLRGHRNGQTIRQETGCRRDAAGRQANGHAPSGVQMIWDLADRRERRDTRGERNGVVSSTCSIPGASAQDRIVGEHHRLVAVANVIGEQRPRSARPGGSRTPPPAFREPRRSAGNRSPDGRRRQHSPSRSAVANSKPESERRRARMRTRSSQPSVTLSRR